MKSAVYEASKQISAAFEQLNVLAGSPLVSPDTIEALRDASGLSPDTIKALQAIQDVLSGEDEQDHDHQRTKELAIAQEQKLLTAGEAQAPAPSPASRPILNGDTRGPVTEERRRLRDACKTACKNAGIKLTHEMIARVASERWQSRTQIDKWLQGDRRYDGNPDRLIRKALASIEADPVGRMKQLQEHR